MSRSTRIAIVVVATVALAIGAILVWLTSDRYLISSNLAQCHRIIDKGEQCWGDEVGQIVKDTKRRVADKRMLAERLLADKNGSLAAEGMVMVVEERFADGDRLLQAHAHDTRWNYWLDLNDHWSQVCLVAWKIKTGRPVSPEERRLLESHSLSLMDTFGIEYNPNHP